MRCRIASGLVLLFTVACTENRTDAVEQLSASTTSQTAPPTTPPSSTLRGTLKEQIPVEPYVYVRLETADGEIWAAVNEAPLSVGQEVIVYNAFPMEQFASQTLGRTFDRIYFGALEPVGGAVAGSAPATLGPAGAPAADIAVVGPIARAEGNDARTINELWQNKEELAGSTVRVRGVVVKYNAAVMGKNWIHLQDGSGDAAHGTHDMVVTSMDATTVGDTITVRGIVRRDRDLGAGYVFALLVEEASIVAR